MISSATCTALTRGAIAVAVSIAVVVSDTSTLTTAGALLGLCVLASSFGIVPGACPDVLTAVQVAVQPCVQINGPDVPAVKPNLNPARTVTLLLFPPCSTRPVQ
jgi:hypothetical protein